ncbi:MAG: putative signal transducing protein [Omnitrophica WOR_2 bacterium]|jgi:hypothetical protein
MEGWTQIYAGTRIEEIDFFKELLEENNIIAVIVNKQDSIYLIGEIELYVPVEDAFNANQIINKFRSE